jgi:hypothetical protein
MTGRGWANAILPRSRVRNRMSEKMQCGKPSLGAAQDVAPMRWRGPGTLLCTLMCT